MLELFFFTSLSFFIFYQDSYCNNVLDEVLSYSSSSIELAEHCYVNPYLDINPACSILNQNTEIFFGKINYHEYGKCTEVLQDARFSDVIKAEVDLQYVMYRIVQIEKAQKEEEK